MEGELGAEIDFVSDNADHNQITIGHNTSCNRGGGGWWLYALRQWCKATRSIDADELLQMK